MSYNIAPANAARRKTLADSDRLLHQMLKAPEGPWAAQLEAYRGRKTRSSMLFMKRAIANVASGTEPAFQMKQHRCRVWHQMSQDARDLWLYVLNEDRNCFESIPKAQLNPWLRIARHVLEKWGPGLRPYSYGCNQLRTSEPEVRRCLDQIFKLIRRVARSKAFKKALGRKPRTSAECYRSCAEYFINILKVHGRLLVIRLDLHYKGDAKEISESEDANWAYGKFLRRLRDGKIVPKDDVLGWIAIREYGVDRRIHYHVMIILDGHKHRDGHALTSLYGKDWVHECVGSPLLGEAYSCWPRRHEYKQNGLGHVHYADASMLQGVRSALLYMSKLGFDPDVYVKDELGKNLRKGQPPRVVANRKKLGAPRKAGNDLTLARQILLGIVGSELKGDERVH